MTPRGVLAFCREKEVKAIDLRYTDLFGNWHHVTVPVSRLSEGSFEQGFAVDISGHPAASGCDRLVIPQASSAFLDPFASIPTLILIGSLQDPITREDDPFDSRIIAERSLNFLQGTGIADRARIAATCEFYLFNDVQVALTPSNSSIRLSSETGFTKRECNTTIRSGFHEPHQSDLSTPPIDSSFDFRNTVMELLTDADIPVGKHFQIGHSGGQAAIEIDTDDLVSTADSVMSTKFMVRNAAKRHGCLATFLPKPIENLRGSGMPLNFSLWKGEEALFGGQGYGGLSEIAILSIGGILHHAPALSAICNPTTNSFRRLRYSDDNPFHLGYAQQTRLAACCIPTTSNDPRAKCIEIRTPDASSNPYLAFAAILMAAIDGIQNKIEPGTPMPAVGEKRNPSRQLPISLWDALDCLEQDCSFLMRGEVFSQEMLDSWLRYKRDVERPAVESYPTPAEYQRYFNC